MPEGDTIFRTAQALDRALGGRELVRFEARRLIYRPFPPGTRVQGAQARGKHCLVHFDDGRTLRTHLRMNGSWHLYRSGERWRRAAPSARAVIDVGLGIDDERGWTAVCFSAPVVEFVPAGGTRATAHLGPDLSRFPVDVDEAVRRLARYSDPERTIGEAFLDQRIACGVGNVYKSEACHACGVDPFRTVGDIDDDLRNRLLATASDQLRANLHRARRVTTSSGGLAVYGRSGKPCPRCGGTIVWARQGEANRGTYWCPGCQH